MSPSVGIQFRRKGLAHFQCGRRSLSPAECLKAPAPGQLRILKSDLPFSDREGTDQKGSAGAHFIRRQAPPPVLLPQSFLRLSRSDLSLERSSICLDSFRKSRKIDVESKKENGLPPGGRQICQFYLVAVFRCAFCLRISPPYALISLMQGI